MIVRPKEESLFTADMLYNCIDEEVWVYYLPEPLTEEFEDFIRCLGRLKYPLGKGFSFIKLETEGFLLTGNIGSKELRLTIKHGAAVNPYTLTAGHSQQGAGVNIKDIFEIHLNNYLRGR